MHEISLCESILDIVTERAATDRFSRVTRIRLYADYPRNSNICLTPAISPRFAKKNPVTYRLVRSLQVVALARKVISTGNVIVIGRARLRIEDGLHLRLTFNFSYSAARGDACFSLVQRVRMSRDFALRGAISSSWPARFAVSSTT